jgi:hypothetical protein
MVKVFRIGEYEAKQTFVQMEKDRMKKRLGRSLYGEALSSYFAGNYRGAFILAYICMASPIVVNAKRLYRKKKQDRTLDDYRLYKCLELCLFLSDTTKEEISEKMKFRFTFESDKDKEFYWSISDIRNKLLHPEDDWHNLIMKKLDFKKVSLQLLNIAAKVHNEYGKYLASTGHKKRKAKEFAKSKALTASSF